MDADWYVDPLGRFDGRFFDGDRWTERVSNGGKLAIDPDFAPMLEGAGPPPAAGDAPLMLAGGDELDSTTGGDVLVRRSVRRGLPAAKIIESPVRAVAVLEGDGFVGGGRTRNGFGESSSAKRRIMLGGLLGVIVVLAVVGYLVLRNDDTSAPAAAEPLDLADEQAQRIEDLEAGGVDLDADQESVEDLDVDAPVGGAPGGVTFGAAELIEVGTSRIVNGMSVLDDLESWHRDFAAARGVELGPDAGCWFAQLAGAALRSAHCGPVGATAARESLYDLVPLVFEDVVIAGADGGQIAQPVVDEAMIDMVLSNALTLVGPNAPAD